MGGGFATLPAMFEWVIESPWFSVAPYLDEVDSHLRRRAAERTTVSRFIAYLREKGVAKRFAFEDRAAYLPLVVSAFPRGPIRPGQIAREQRRGRGTAGGAAARFSGKRVMCGFVPGPGRARRWGS